jgi:membrane-bound metal-dependent hydrolase YbcI (DUF457 family)
VFIGHFGVALAAKPAAPSASLGTLFLASELIDLVWPTLLLLGWETVEIAPGATRLSPLEFTHYPITHSLAAVLLWAILFGVVYYLIRRTVAPALVCGGLVVSHWLLDAVVHKPDLPLYPGGAARIGLGLWDYPAPALALELAVFAVGVVAYLRNTRALDRTGAVAFWSLAGFLAVLLVLNAVGPPPPSSEAVAWVGEAQWLLVAWGYWIDRHRAARVT